MYPTALIFGAYKQSAALVQMLSIFSRGAKFPVAMKKQRSLRSLFFSEASTRFELVIEVLQTFALPLGYDAILNFLSDKLLL